MINALMARLFQKHRTMDFPNSVPLLPALFRGLPQVDSDKCGENCAACKTICPTQSIDNGKIDMGSCIFCGECERACTEHAIQLTKQHALAVRNRQELVTNGKNFPEAAALEKKMLDVFGRSLKLRQVSAGGCNACESDINVLTTIGWDLGRFGIQIVASPRHADGLLVTGPVTNNMHLALQKTYDALPAPKLVIAIGACAISGGIYKDSPEQQCGADKILPVDLYIPGCPPHPLTILDGLLRLLDKMPKR